MKDGRQLSGHWYEDRILEWFDVPALMVVFDAQANKLDLFYGGGEKKC